MVTTGCCAWPLGIDNAYFITCCVDSDGVSVFSLTPENGGMLREVALTAQQAVEISRCLLIARLGDHFKNSGRFAVPRRNEDGCVWLEWFDHLSPP